MERLRQHQRSLAKAQRELDRERTKLEQSEKKLIADIKKSAKLGQLVRRLISSSSHRSRLPPLVVSLKRNAVCPPRRTLARSWRRTWSARADTSKSSSRCARNCRRSGYASRRCAATSKWPRPCAEPLVYAVSVRRLPSGPCPSSSLNVDCKKL